MGVTGRRLATVAAVVAGLASGIAVAAVTVGGAAEPRPEAGRSVAAAHLPPLLRLAGEPVTLRYAIVCAGADDVTAAAGTACDGAGDVFVRAGHAGSYLRLPLERGDDAKDGRYFAVVPPSIAASPNGFSYYAVVRDEASGATATLPAAGADAPQTSYLLRNPVTVDLGEHRFGATRTADARVLSAAWGAAAEDAGLAGGDTAARIGPASFDVAADGTVTLLDEVNRRVVRWRNGVSSPLPLDVPPALDDMSVAPDGAIYVADGAASAGETPLLRMFARDGRLLNLAHLPERTWSQLRVGPDGPVVEQQPSEQWMPRAGAAAGRAGRPLPDGSRLIVLRSGVGEVRVARTVSGVVHESWRVRSATPLAEVQLAERLGNRLVLVVKAYSSGADEYEVLVDGHGAFRAFSVLSASWAESAPLARFRLVGTTLYQLGSTAAGAFVDSYDLGGGR